MAERGERDVGNRKDTGAKWDQQLATLFYQSGWTQERLAEKEGKSRPYITRLLLFGRFLNFVPIGTNPEIPLSSITEGKFRSYWERTEGGNERQRFAAVTVTNATWRPERFDNLPQIGAWSAPRPPAGTGGRDLNRKRRLRAPRSR
jgi:hypothetical protein